MRDLLQPMHLLVILLVFMVLFGGKKLADVGKGLGEGIRNFKSSLKGDDPPSDGPSRRKEAGVRLPGALAVRSQRGAASNRFQNKKSIAKNPATVHRRAGFFVCPGSARVIVTGSPTSSWAGRSRPSRPWPRGTSRPSWPGS